ncbi:hypothetical protein P3T76_013559 [Phytophthora citrophthora]|uniref:Uncharacterized protein n=1 Tax=Phytophthora citrophthora TaxID=4793 RepID=A0AAD9G3H6_9STRA|nr:hypothetical protein P3T76_013559 [Phytophthora citrophthora]
MATVGMKPARIYTALLHHFGLPPSELPPLQQVQNFVCHFRRTKLGRSGTIASIEDAVYNRSFTGTESEHEPFRFGWEIDGEGKIVVGNGSSENPFLVGFFFTKALLRQASRSSGTFTFHLGATSKTNQVGYPVITCGITDIARRFRLFALFVISQLQEAHFANA